MTTNYLTPADAEMAFYDALERNDLEDMMAVWLDNDAVVCVHPGASRLEGVVTTCVKRLKSTVRSSVSCWLPISISKPPLAGACCYIMHRPSWTSSWMTWI